jgi:hypothetical protein
MRAQNIAEIPKMAIHKISGSPLFQVAQLQQEESGICRKQPT